MEKRTRISTGLCKNKWFRIGASISLAFVLTAVVMLVPIIAGANLQISVPLLPQAEPLDLSLLFNVSDVHATNGLTITKSASPAGFVDQNGFITYTLTVTNETNTSINVLVVSDSVPANTSCNTVDGGEIFNGSDSTSPTAGNWVGDQSSCDGGTAQWSYISLFNPGGTFDHKETVQLVYRVRVASPLRNQVDTIVNGDYQVVTLSPAFSDTASITVTHLVNAPEWQISKSSSPAAIVQPGDSLSYTLTITNSGNLTVTGDYTIADTLPTHTNFVTASPTATLNSNIATWNFNQPIGIGSAITVSYVVTVTEPLTNGTAIVNQSYSVTGVNVFSQAFGAPITVTVDAPVTMTIGKRDGPDPVQAGALLNYTITLTNASSSKGPAQGIVFNDTLPPNTVFDSAGILGGDTATITDPGVGNTGTVTWTITSPNDLLLDQSVELTLSVRVQSPLPNNTIITNSNYGVTVSNTLSAVQGIVPVTTTVASAPNITFTKSVTPQSTFTNQPVVYTVVVTNTGNETALNVPFTDTLPAGFTPSTINWTLTITGRDISNNPGVATQVFSTTTPGVNGTYFNHLTATVNAVELSIGPVAPVTVQTPVNLQLTKQRIDGSGPIVAGDTITYTLTITNQGPFTVAAVVTDTYTAGAAALVTYSHSLGGPPCSGTTTVVCNFSSFSGTGVITLALTTLSTYSGTLTNTATIAPSASGVDDNNLSDNTGNTTDTVRLRQAEIEINKARVGGGILVAGEPVTYTITITNNGSDTAGVIVTDTYAITEAGFASCSNGCSTPTAGTVVWTISPFTNTQALTLVLNSNPAFSGTFTNSAVMTFTNAFFNTVDPQPLNNNSSAATSVRLRQAEIEINKARVGSGILIAGEPVTYTITITNNGSDTAGVIVTDTYAITEAGFASCSNGCSTPTAGTVVWTISPFTNTQALTLVLNSDPSFSGTLTNSAVMTFTNAFFNTVDPQPLNNNGSAATSVRLRQAEIEINKARVGSGTLIAGEPVTYTITITNNGSDTAGVIVTDTYAITEAGFASCSDSCTTPTAGTVVWTISPFTNTQSLTLVLNSDPSFSGTLTNSAVMTFTNAFFNTVDPQPLNNSGAAATSVRLREAELQILKVRNGSGSVIAGNLITYTLFITNAGIDSVEIIVTDTYTATEASFAGCSDSCTTPTVGTVVWTVSPFTNTQALTLALTSQPAFSGTLTNDAQITATTFALDTVPGNNNSSASVNVTLIETDLQVTKQRIGGTGVVLAGAPITYTVTITNTGPVPVNTVLTDTFTNATLDSVTASVPGCGAGSPVICNIANFSNTGVITLVLNTSLAFSGTVANTAVITANAVNVSDTDPSNNSDTVTTTVRTRSTDLQVSKVRVGSGAVKPGDQITYTITITNAGPDPVLATLFDSVSSSPTGAAVTGLSSSISGWSCTFSTATMNCSNLNFALGSTQFTVVITTSAAYSGTVTNNVNISTPSPTIELNPGNNSDFVNTSVIQVGTPALAITKSANPASGTAVSPGSTIDYTITVQNSGSGAATGLIITDTLQAGDLGFVSCSSNGNCSGGSTTVITAATLAPAQSITATIRVTVTSSTSGTIINNIANLNSDQQALATNSNIVSHPVITTGGSTVYLPVIFKLGTASCVDLQISGLQLLAGNVVSVTVTNAGTCATDSNFWVDVYGDIQGSQPQDLVGATADRRWKSVSVNAVYGVGWEVPILAAGASRLLTTDGSNGGLSPTSPDQNWPPPPALVTVYAYADSYDINDPSNETFVEIPETNENNNQSGSVTTAGSLTLENSPPALSDFAPRRDLE